MAYILTDTCFWIGLFDETDGYYDKSTEYADVFKDENTFVIPWPCLYETLSDRMIGNRKRMIAIEQVFLNGGLGMKVEFLDDSSYKEEALNKVFEYNKIHGSTFSLTDSIIREIIMDSDVLIHGFITYNEKDFKDVCDLRKIEIQS
jgi:hypothetical protein